MGELIKGIRIHKSTYAEGAPVEECEKIERGVVIRYQRRTDVSLGERFLRIFSDLFNGVTKAKGKLCNLANKLPDEIFVKNYSIPIKSQADNYAVGLVYDPGKNWMDTERDIKIVFIDERSDTTVGRAQSGDIVNQIATKHAPPDVPPRDGRPPLTPSREGRRPLQTAAEATEDKFEALISAGMPDLPATPPLPEPIERQAIASSIAENIVAAPETPAMLATQQAELPPPEPPPMPDNLLKRKSPTPLTAQNAQRPLQNPKPTSASSVKPAENREAGNQDALFAELQKKISSIRSATTDDAPAKINEADRDGWDT